MTTDNRRYSDSTVLNNLEFNTDTRMKNITFQEQNISGINKKYSQLMMFPFYLY